MNYTKLKNPYMSCTKMRRPDIYHICNHDFKIDQFDKLTNRQIMQISSICLLNKNFRNLQLAFQVKYVLLFEGTLYGQQYITTIARFLLIQKSPKWKFWRWHHIRSNTTGGFRIEMHPCYPISSITCVNIGLNVA